MYIEWKDIWCVHMEKLFLFWGQEMVFLWWSFFLWHSIGPCNLQPTWLGCFIRGRTAWEPLHWLRCIFQIFSSCGAKCFNCSLSLSLSLSLYIYIYINFSLLSLIWLSSPAGPSLLALQNLSCRKIGEVNSVFGI